ncbi:MAG: TadE/TadG family type IV pilus assembly protein [Terriglobales bacterium]
MVEFALVAPLVMALMFGMVEMGLALYTYHFVASAARQGARYAIVRGAKCDSWASACPASASDVQTYVRSLDPGAIDASSLNVTTSWSPDNSPGNRVTVTVQYAFGLNVPFISAATLTMHSSSQMVVSQ